MFKLSFIIFIFSLSKTNSLDELIMELVNQEILKVYFNMKDYNLEETF